MQIDEMKVKQVVGISTSANPQVDWFGTDKLIGTYLSNRRHATDAMLSKSPSRQRKNTNIVAATEAHRTLPSLP
jgi:hypothetical protein